MLLWRHHFIFFLLLFIVCITALPVFAEEMKDENIEKSNDDPQVTITPSQSYSNREVLLFPLKTPALAFRIATYPVEWILRFQERHYIIKNIVEFLSNDEKTFFVYPFVFGGFGGGIEGGIGLIHTDLFHKEYKLSMRYETSTNLDQKAKFSFGHPEATYLLSRPLGFKIKANYENDKDELFYGAGNDSLESNISRYGIEEVSGGIELSYQLPRGISINPHFFFTNFSTRTATETSDPSVEDIFFPNSLSGFRESIDYFDIGISLTHESRDNKIIPEYGGFRSFTFRRMESLSGEFSFNEYSVDLLQFIRLGAPRYVLVFHNQWTFQQATENSQVPFTNLATLDVDSPLRSFNRGRFRDRNFVVANVEYRYPVWDLVDGTLFFDTGRVFDKVSNFSFDDFKYSVGGGIRIRTRYLFLFRTQAAYGNEGFNLIFAVDRAL